MRFIKLTNYYRDYEPIYVNVECISSLVRDPEDKFTYVGIVGDYDSYKALESPESIIKLIECSDRV